MIFKCSQNNKLLHADTLKLNRQENLLLRKFLMINFLRAQLSISLQYAARRAMASVIAFWDTSWKQFFLIICMNMCKGDPTIKELAEIVGSSHQNVKQLLIKLENKGFVDVYIDELDKRKQRIRMTEYCKT